MLKYQYYSIVNAKQRTSQKKFCRESELRVV